MGWVEDAQRAHTRAYRLLQQAAKNASISVPVVSSRNTAPGWLFLGEIMYTYPDVTYPWDPAVIRAIREIEPDVVPITIRSVWQHANYGAMEKPIILVRHGLARAIRNPRLAPHRFRCEMPYGAMSATPTLRSSAHALVDPRPNYVEVNWHDRKNKELGPDLPGAYIPHDWELYYAAYEHAVDFSHMRKTATEWVQEDLIQPHVARERRREQQQEAEFAAFYRDLADYYCLEPSDLEIKERMLKPYEPAPKPITMAVPSAYEGASA